MRSFYLKPAALDMWLHQNKAECVDYIEGCLLDNLLIDTKRGTAAVLEHYINANSSDYIVHFADHGNAGEVWDVWDACKRLEREEA